MYFAVTSTLFSYCCMLPDILLSSVYLRISLISFYDL